MARPEAVSDSDLLRLIDEDIASGDCFANDPGLDGSSVAGVGRGDRQTALEYFDGRMRDLPPEKGRSSVVSRDVADVVGAMLPGLVRVFTGSDRVVVYTPNTPGDEAFADQASDYVNHVFLNECDGFLFIVTAILDALQVRNGIGKVYWDDTPVRKVEHLTGLSDEQLVLLGDDPEVEFTGYRSRQETLRDPQADGPRVVTLHDVRLARTVSSGRLAIENVPGEDFGVSRGAKSIEAARVTWHQSRQTRSDLVKQGYAKEKVWALPTSSGRIGTDASAERGDDGLGTEGFGANTEIEITEAYLFADCDGDGIAEPRKVVLAGGAGGRQILSNEEWGDERPFIDLRAQIVPHRWMGRSIADNTMDLQRVKTSLLRSALDNTYAQNRPQREVLDRAIVNPDEVLNPSFGGVIRVKEQGAVRDIVTPFVAANTLEVMRFVDGVIEKRTGVSGSTASLDPTALEPQTATAEQLEHDASYAQVEMVARTMAEIGLKPLFRKILKLICANQDRPRTLRLRDKWVEFDPRAWNAEMDATVNIGLGTGSRERDLAMLSGVAARQEKIIETLGPNNPIVTPSMYVATLHKMVEASGLKGPQNYFADVNDEEFATWQASRPAPVDPRVEAEQAKLRAQIEGDQQRAAADLQIERERMEADAGIEEERMDRDFALRRDEMVLEAQLRAGEIAAGNAISTNIPRQA